MHKPITVPSLAIAGLLTLALAACGDSTPESSTTPAPSASATPSDAAVPSAELPAAAAYSGPTGAFAQIPAAELEAGVRDTADCTVDVIDGSPLTGSPLQSASSAVFAGWVADAVSGSVPADMRLVLSGAQNYAVGVNTGLDRGDVATALGNPAFSTSGYEIKADLSQVAAGEYTVVMLYSVSGQAVKCTSMAKVTVQ